METKTIKFIKSTKTNGKIETETIFTWRNIDADYIDVICQNFIDGFLYGFLYDTERYMRKPICMQIDGYKTWSRHYYDDAGKGFMFSFVDENGNVIGKNGKK